MSKPYIIITTGPSGSGKTLLAEKTIEYLKSLDKDMSTSFTKILIDELIENNIAYKEKISSIVKECVDEYRQVNKSSKIKECFTCSKSNCYYLRPDVFEKLSKSYWYVREKPYCNESSHLSCAILNDELLKQAVEKNENIGKAGHAEHLTTEHASLVEKNIGFFLLYFSPVPARASRAPQPSSCRSASARP